MNNKTAEEITEALEFLQEYAKCGIWHNYMVNEVGREIKLKAMYDSIELVKKRIEELEAKITDINGLSHLTTVTQLLDKLDYATELLREAKDANFDSNLGARIKAFIPNPSSNGKQPI
jgi:hypothetical protein